MLTRLKKARGGARERARGLLKNFVIRYTRPLDTEPTLHRTGSRSGRPPPSLRSCLQPASSQTPRRETETGERTPGTSALWHVGPFPTAFTMRWRTTITVGAELIRACPRHIIQSNPTLHSRRHSIYIYAPPSSTSSSSSSATGRRRGRDLLCLLGRLGDLLLLLLHLVRDEH